MFRALHRSKRRRIRTKNDEVGDMGRPGAGDTKGRILEATELLFIEFGYEAMSLRQITSAARKR
jgi:AcrR family transcriptional regulator